jgi:glycosyltransferase involved in cell wall biosynthesis
MAMVGGSGLDGLTPPRRVLSVVMPVYNERATFTQVMDRLLHKRLAELDIEIIVVESNSTDGTRNEVLRYTCEHRVMIIMENIPHGKGHAVRRGLAAATGDFILIQDADLEYSLDDYEALLEPLLRGETAFVLGARCADKESLRTLRHLRGQEWLGHILNLGHSVFLALFNAMYGQRLTDPFTMYKVFRRDCLDGLSFECNRFDFDWELVIKLIRAGFSPLEVPVRYAARSFREGKKISLWRDPLSWLIACVKYRFVRIR